MMEIGKMVSIMVKEYFFQKKMVNLLVSLKTVYLMAKESYMLIMGYILVNLKMESKMEKELLISIKGKFYLCN